MKFQNFLYAIDWNHDTFDMNSEPNSSYWVNVNTKSMWSKRHHAAAVLRQQKGPFANAAVFLEVARRVAMLYKLFVGI